MSENMSGLVFQNRLQLGVDTLMENVLEQTKELTWEYTKCPIPLQKS